MIVIPNTWFDEKVQDEVATTEQTTALKAYLEDDIEAEEAGMLITADVHQETLADTTSAEEINEELCKLWGFIIDVIVDWPSEHIKIANLLDTISKLPHVDRTGRDSLEVFMDGTGTVRASELWQDLPRFWNSFSDYWHCKLLNMCSPPVVPYGCKCKRVLTVVQRQLVGHIVDLNLARKKRLTLNGLTSTHLPR